MFTVFDGADLTSSVAGVTAAKIDSNTPHIRRKHRRAKSGSKIESNGDGNGEWQRYALISFHHPLLRCCLQEDLE